MSPRRLLRGSVGALAHSVMSAVQTMALKFFVQE
jgi:hypothetical protein